MMTDKLDEFIDVVGTDIRECLMMQIDLAQLGPHLRKCERCGYSFKSTVVGSHREPELSVMMPERNQRVGHCDWLHARISRFLADQA